MQRNHYKPICMNMKKLGLILACLCLVWMAQAQQTDAYRWANIQRYAHDNDSLLVAQGRARVVFLGNSITQHWVSKHPSFFVENGYTGRGISGQTSSQFLLRFREDVLKLQPQVLVLNAGTNDIAENAGEYHEEMTFGHICSMIELAQAHHIKVILTSVLPAARFGWRPEVTPVEKIRSLNRRLQAYAEENGIPYVDYYAAMVNLADGSLPYADDGVHPTVEGYLIMESLVRPVVEQLLR